MPTIFDENGIERFCGCLPRTTEPDGSIFPIVGDAGTEAVPLVPRSQWTETSLRHHVWNIHNQGNQNSCCPTAYAGLLETLREIQGLARVPLSQAYPYHYANGGRDQGASLDAVFFAIRDKGITPASIVDPMDWRGVNWPADVDDQAERWRIVEQWDMLHVDALGSSLEAGLPGVFGVFWQGGGGHAIYAIGKRRAARGNSWDFEIANSWGRQWGENGLGWLPESQVAEGIRYFGGWIPRLQRIQSDDPMPLPIS